MSNELESNSKNLAQKIMVSNHIYTQTMIMLDSNGTSTILTPSQIIRKIIISHLLLRKLKIVICSIISCVILGISFIEICKNNFHWLLIIDKMKGRAK